MIDNGKSISRRDLLHTAAIGLGAAALAAGALGADPGAKAASSDSALSPAPVPAQSAAQSAHQGAKGAFAARVVSVKGADAFSGSEPDPAVTARMLDAAAAALGGVAAAEFWRSRFSADDVVGIKLNCISRAARPNKALIDAVVGSLTRAGVKENNIIFWDRFEDQLVRRARLKLNTGPDGVRVYGTEGGDKGLSGYDAAVYYETDKDNPAQRGETGARSLVSRIVTQDVTKIINMPVLKDHNQAGITACLKNLTFGSVNNTARFHASPLYCSPAIADIYSLPAIRDKAVLHIVDALRACYNGGPDASNPAYITPLSTLYLSTDPVACDTVCLDTITRLRAEAHLPPLEQTSGRPVHIADAAAKGLGVGDRAKIEVVEVKA